MRKFPVDQEVIQDFLLTVMSDTTHSHVDSILRYGKPGLDLLLRHCNIKYVDYEGGELNDLLLPFYVSRISGTLSKWCAPDTKQLDVYNYVKLYNEKDSFVPERETVSHWLENKIFSHEYGGYGLVVKFRYVSVIVDGSKRACVCALADEKFKSICIESTIVPLLWSCEFFQSYVKGSLT